MGLNKRATKGGNTLGSFAVAAVELGNDRVIGVDVEVEDRSKIDGNPQGSELLRLPRIEGECGCRTGKGYRVSRGQTEKPLVPRQTLHRAALLINGYERLYAAAGLFERSGQGF